MKGYLFVDKTKLASNEIYLNLDEFIINIKHDSNSFADAKKFFALSQISFDRSVPNEYYEYFESEDQKENLNIIETSPNLSIEEAVNNPIISKKLDDNSALTIGCFYQINRNKKIEMKLSFDIVPLKVNYIDADEKNNRKTKKQNEKSIDIEPKL